MTNVAVVVVFAYAALSLVGGILGAIQGSPISLVAGGAAAVLLAVGGWLAIRGTFWGFVLAAVVGIALAGRFLPIYLRGDGAVWPHLVIGALGVVTAIVAALAVPGLRRT